MTLPWGQVNGLAKRFAPVDAIYHAFSQLSDSCDLKVQRGEGGVKSSYGGFKVIIWGENRKVVIFYLGVGRLL